MPIISGHAAARKESPAGQNRSRDFLWTNLAARAFNRHCACALFFAVALSLSFFPFLFHSGTKVTSRSYRLLSDSSTLSSFSSLSLFFFPFIHASSFSPVTRRLIILLVPFPRWKPAQLSPSINAIHTGIPLLSHLTTPLAKRITIHYGESLIVRHSLTTVRYRSTLADKAAFSTIVIGYAGT